MKNKFIKVLVTTMAMVMCMGMTALAAPSPSSDSFIVKGGSTAKDCDGKDITSLLEIKDVSKMTPEEMQQVLKLKTAEGLQGALKADYNENMVILEVVDVALKEEIAFPATITFQVTGVTSATKGFVLHWTGSEWEKLNVTTGDGSVTVTFSSLSPVAFAMDMTTLVYHTIDPKELDFGTVNQDDKGGYIQPNVQTVTVNNTGISTVILTKPASANYDIGNLSKDTLDIGETATFTVQPKRDLSAGTYNETLKVTTDKNTTAEVVVNFTVKAKSEDATEIIKDADSEWTKAPQTGDSSNLALWLILLALCGSTIAIISIRKKSI